MDLVFAYFLGNGSTGVRFATSEDGVFFRPSFVDGGKRSALHPGNGGDLLRDPFLFVDSSSSSSGGNDVYHLLWTTGWATTTIGHSTSTDLRTWSEPHTFSPVATLSEEAGALCNMWAPKACWDPLRRSFLLTWSSKLQMHADEGSQPQPQPQPQRLYYTHTADFASFTDPQVLLATSRSVIDGLVFRVNDSKWGLAVKDESPLGVVPAAGPAPAEEEVVGTKCAAPTQIPVELRATLHVLWADNPLGPYQKSEAPAGEPMAASVGPVGTKLEGPAVYVHKGGNGGTGTDDSVSLLLYADAYTDQQMRLFQADAATGLDSSRTLLWRDMTADLSLPRGCRHGSVCRVSHNVWKNLHTTMESESSESAAESNLNMLMASPSQVSVSNDWHRELFPSRLEAIIRLFAAGDIATAAFSSTNASASASANANADVVDWFVKYDDKAAADSFLYVTSNNEAKQKGGYRDDTEMGQGEGRDGGENTSEREQPILHLPALLSAAQRKEVHVLADNLLLHHPSVGIGTDRHIVMCRL